MYLKDRLVYDEKYGYAVATKDGLFIILGNILNEFTRGKMSAKACGDEDI